MLTPGRPADVRCASTVRLALQRGSTVQDAAGVLGMMIHATTAKNKVAPPLRKAELKLNFGQGFTSAAESEGLREPVGAEDQS
jgi:recombination protein RecA